MRYRNTYSSSALALARVVLVPSLVLASSLTARANEHTAPAISVATPTSSESAAEAPAPIRYFVKVGNVRRDEVRRLAEAGFDVAGYDAEGLVAGIVATSEELDALAQRGLAYSVESASQPLDAGFALSDYTSPAEMSAFLDSVQAAYPNLAKKIMLRDDLFDGNVVYAMKITADVNQPNNRPRFLLDAQHHAREVMTVEIAKDMIDYLTSRYATDIQVKNWLDSIEIWVVPIVNPDGAAHVFVGDNFWRKNRHPGCPVDLNRNYEIGWNSCNGSSASCSSETYRGTSPVSEQETQAMIQLFSDVHAFLSLSYHSYGQMIMYSYGCSDPDEMAAMDVLAQSLNSILVKDNGAPGGWDTGPIWSTIYLADGGSCDTAYGRAGTYAYTIEVSSSSFQPDYATWRNVTVQRQRTAWQFYLDKTLTTPHIRGKVTDAYTGDPLPAQVAVAQVTHTHGEYPRKADPRGLYHWLAQAGQTYDISFSMPGYCTETRIALVGSSPYTLDVALSYPLAPAFPGAAAAGDNQIDVSWSTVAGAAEYRVLRALSPGGPYAPVATVPAPGTTYQDTTVSGGVTYYYVIRAFEDCESANSVEVSAATTGPCTLGPAFSGVSTVTNGASSTCSLSLNWPSASAYCGGPVSYNVYRSTSSSFVPGPGNLIASGLGSTSYVDQGGLGNGVTYYYIVRSVDATNGTADANTSAKSAVPTGPYALGAWSDDAGDASAAKLTVTAPWTVQATGGRTAPKVYATGTTANNVCSALTSPVVQLGLNPSLTFHSKYNLETNYDAGIVEVATGPAFATWTKLTTVNYPNPLVNDGNACGFPTSTSATAFSFTNSTPAYSALPYSGSLSAYAGQNVKLRWSLSTDGGVNGTGWWVDDVQITNAMLPGNCTAGPALVPTEVSPSGSAMLCEPSGAGTTIRCNYTPGCGTTDNTAYWGTGPIAGGLSWSGAACALGNNGLAEFDAGTPPVGGFTYFVIVGRSDTKESSYGLSFEGGSSAERPEAVGIGACDKPQDLTGVCP